MPDDGMLTNTVLGVQYYKSNTYGVRNDDSISIILYKSMGQILIILVKIYIYYIYKTSLLGMIHFLKIY